MQAAKLADLARHARCFAQYDYCTERASTVFARVVQFSTMMCSVCCLLLCVFPPVSYLHVQDGFTALCLAAFNGHYEIVRLLVEAKADVNLQTKVYIICTLFLTLLFIIENRVCEIH